MLSSTGFAVPVRAEQAAEQLPAGPRLPLPVQSILKRANLRPDRPAGERVRNRHITLVPARGARVVNEG